MQTDVKKVFYFHADANSLGGFLDEPFRYIPTPCSVSLSPTGGSSTTQAENFCFQDHISATSCHTHVSGRPAKKNGPWTQRVVSVVKGFKLLGRIAADNLVAQIFIVHPEAGGVRKISFAGSRFDNLTIDGKPVMPVLNSTLLPQHHRDCDAYNQDTFFSPEMEWPSLARVARSQSERLCQRDVSPDWVRNRFGWIAAEENGKDFGPEGYTLCSLVDNVEGLTSDRSFGHCIEIPDLGRIFLGEAMVFPHAVSLSMVRAELGCKIFGQASAASVRINGSTCPPGFVS